MEFSDFAIRESVNDGRSAAFSLQELSEAAESRRIRDIVGIAGLLRLKAALLLRNG